MMSEAAPAPSGLGNFKGVMLCNRPDDTRADAGPAPFKATVAATYSDQLGLNPAAKEPRAQGPKQRNVAIQKHCAWLKQLQSQMAVQRRLENEEAEAYTSKHAAVKAFCEKQREQVRLLRDDAVKVTCEMQRAEAEKRRANRLEKEEKKKPEPPKPKPRWAMTESEAENMGEEEQEDLLDFAEGLNFEEFMGDLEFREAVLAMKDRSGRIQSEQEKFRSALCDQLNQLPPDDDMRSEAPSEAPSQASQSQARSRRKAQEEWDASTCTSEASSSYASSAGQSAAQRVREQNSEIRSVHSNRSVQAIIERQQRVAQEAIPEGQEA